MKILKPCFVLAFSFLFIISVKARPDWEKDSFKVKLSGGSIIITSGGNELVNISSINFNFTPPKSIEIENKSTDKLLLKLVYPPAASYRTVSKDISAELEITTGSGTIHFYSDPKWAQNITVRLKDLNDHFYGILERLYPDNLKSPDLRGNVIDVDVLGDGSQYHENYSSAWSAFYMTNRGYASFFDTFAKGQYTLGINGVTELYHHTGKLNWYLFTGKNGDDILKHYYSIIGKPKYVPLWACGPVAWRDQNNGGKDEILADIEHMTDLKIAFTGWFVDRPYSNGADEWSKMDFNSKFSDPGEWIKTINDKYGIQFMTWVGPMTFADKDFTGLLPNFKGYIDLTNPAAVKEFGERLKKNQYTYNVRGHKMDRGDEQFPEMAKWYDGTPEPEHRNKYIYLYSKYIDQFLTESYGKDQFNFARAAYQRCQPYLSALWGGDSRSTWDGMAGNLANAIRCGYMGFPVWGSDVGGYLGGRISEELYARWLELGSWSGLFEVKLDNAGGKGEDRPPWKYSNELQEIFRQSCERRMEMLPYIYSYANTSYKNGVFMKPLEYAYPEDRNTYELWNEYLWGDAFLVAPIVDSTNSRLVYLPKGEWLDYYDLSKIYSGNQSISATMPLSEIPVYIKLNSVFVTGNLIAGNSKNWVDDFEKTRSLKVHVFPGKPGEQARFDYVDYFNNDTEKKIEVSNIGGKYKVDIEPLSLSGEVEIYSGKRPSSVTVNGSKADFKWEEKKNIIFVEMNKNQAMNIVVSF